MTSRLPRALHPIGWWIWALGLAAAVTRTTNPLLLALALAVLAVVVSTRRGAAPWARAFPYYLALAGTVIAIRVLFRALFAGAVGSDDHVLFRLPQVHWLAGVTIGGPVSVEGTLAAAVDGLRLGVLLCCIGAANVLADPKRALRALPAAVYELGVAVTVAVTVAPQLVESVQRVRRARRLRAAPSGRWRRWRAIVIPVLEDSLERALRLAASMDSRGYGRRGPDPKHRSRATGAVLLAGLLALCAGVYALDDPSAPAPVAIVALAAGATGCLVGLALGRRRVRRTRYRPDPWAWPEWIVAASGAASFGLVVADGSPALNPSFAPLAWPALPVLSALGILLAVVPALAAPPPTPTARRAGHVPRPVRAGLAVEQASA